jgi:hypothetical protein
LPILVALQLLRIFAAVGLPPVLHPVVVLLASAVAICRCAGKALTVLLALVVVRRPITEVTHC